MQNKEVVQCHDERTRGLAQMQGSEVGSVLGNEREPVQDFVELQERLRKWSNWFKITKIEEKKLKKKKLKKKNEKKKKSINYERG